MDRNTYSYVMQVLFVGGISFASQSLDFSNKQTLAINIARFVLYVLSVQGFCEACAVLYNCVCHQRLPEVKLLRRVHRHHVMMFLGAVVLLLTYEQPIIDERFFFILIATLIAKFPEIRGSSVPSEEAVCSGYQVPVQSSSAGGVQQDWQRRPAQTRSLQ
ncbi:hypothetical protein HF086_012335 [Spodoptera exigua]|uniref:Uncharacterized protein n=1 Tax=Spodoptera exigua TaxID=7107 RepID=A0A922SI49_SPOEX|nr:hypothetical protein HF086_012335 [Spodoptera exigua]